MDHEYIQSKVRPHLRMLTEQLLARRPDNPVPLMIKSLSPHVMAPPKALNSEAERLKHDIRTLQHEIADLESELLAAAAKAEDPDTDTDEEEDDADTIHELSKVHHKSLGMRRGGIRANHEKSSEFKPPVHHKTDGEAMRIRQVLQQCFMFEALSKSDLDIVITAMLERTVEAGERIIHEGDDGDVMYVIERGTLDCIKVIDGKEQVVKRVVVGDLFGELALLYNCPRAASVQACERSILWSLDRQTFNHIVRNASMRRRQMHEEFIKGVPLLKSLGAYERSQLTDALHEETVCAGDVVVRQGEKGSKFYLIESGNLIVQKIREDGRVEEIGVLKSGDYFGEHSLLSNDVRAASIVAQRDCVVWSIERKAFHSLLGSLQSDLKTRAQFYEK